MVYCSSRRKEGAHSPKRGAAFFIVQYKVMSPEAVIAWLLEYRYFIIFPLTIIEGPILMIICGFLLKLGYFSFLPLYLVLMAGDLIGDIIWYGIGYHWAHPFIKKYGYIVSITEEIFQKVEDVFRRHQNKILFISKITMGFGFALVTLMAAGAIKIDFKKYMIFNTVGQFVWTGFLIYIGYSFGNLYLTIDKTFREIALIAFILLLMGLLYGLNRYLRGRFLKNKI